MMKDKSKIIKLLEKYYDGDTSVAEEQVLKDYFTYNDDIPKDLEAEKIIFSQTIIQEDKSIGIEIEKLIDSLDKSKNSIYDENKSEKYHTKHIFNISKYRNIAAVAALLTGIFISIATHYNKPKVSDISTYNGIAMTQEEVNEVFANTMAYMNKHISKGNQQIKNINRGINKINKTINKYSNNTQFN